MASSVDGPSTAVMPIARRIAGKSHQRVVHPHQPVYRASLKYPASAPINVPNTAFRATTENPDDDRKLRTPKSRATTGSDRNCPSRTRSRHQADGILKRIASLVGSTGATHGARAAASRMMPNRPSPERNSRWWNKRFSVAPRGMLTREGNFGVETQARPDHYP